MPLQGCVELHNIIVVYSSANTTRLLHSYLARLLVNGKVVKSLHKLSHYRWVRNATMSPGNVDVPGICNKYGSCYGELSQFDVAECDEQAQQARMSYLTDTGTLQ